MEHWLSRGSRNPKQDFGAVSFQISHFGGNASATQSLHFQWKRLAAFPPECGQMEPCATAGKRLQVVGNALKLGFLQMFPFCFPGDRRLWRADCDWNAHSCAKKHSRQVRKMLFMHRAVPFFLRCLQNEPEWKGCCDLMPFNEAINRSAIIYQLLMLFPVQMTISTNTCSLQSSEITKRIFTARSPLRAQFH